MASASDKYRCEPQQRILRLLIVLAGNEITGMTTGEVAREMQCLPSVAVRDLANLQQAGMAEKVPSTDHWRLAPVVVQIAMKHLAAIDRAENWLDETRNRYSRHS